MQMLVSTLQQTHHIFLTLFLFFIFIIVREAELLMNKENFGSPTDNAVNFAIALFFAFLGVIFLYGLKYHESQ